VVGEWTPAVDVLGEAVQKHDAGRGRRPGRSTRGSRPTAQMKGHVSMMG
jgi:hypothetical protein